MKKQYEKPMLLAESFQLTDHISGACNAVDADSNFKVTWHSASNCSLSVKDENGAWLPAMFTDTANNCSDIGILPGDFQHTPLEECYNNMGSTYNYFAS